MGWGGSDKSPTVYATAFKLIGRKKSLKQDLLQLFRSIFVILYKILSASLFARYLTCPEIIQTHLVGNVLTFLVSIEYGRNGEYIC